MRRLFLIGTLLILLVISSAASTGAFQNNLRTRAIESALEQTKYTFYYDNSYSSIPYPNGDVPKDRGVCSDVIVRSFRNAGVDLQQQVHEDMAHNFSAYPKIWGLKKTDANIDHRRVANLMTFFTRRNKMLPITKNAQDYLPGDVVAWRLDNGLYHIGMVIDRTAADNRYAVVHNIGSGAKVEDVLFAWRIIGHYRFF